jgi:hypothetical protein
MWHHLFWCLRQKQNVLVLPFHWMDVLHAAGIGLACVLRGDCPWIPENFTRIMKNESLPAEDSVKVVVSVGWGILSQDPNLRPNPGCIVTTTSTSKCGHKLCCCLCRLHPLYFLFLISSDWTIITMPCLPSSVCDTDTEHQCMYCTRITVGTERPLPIQNTDQFFMVCRMKPVELNKQLKSIPRSNTDWSNNLKWTYV